MSLRNTSPCSSAALISRCAPSFARAPPLLCHHLTEFLDLGRVADLGPPRGTEPMVVAVVAPDRARLTIRASEASMSVLAMINAFRGRA